ncbi:hypothetical protein ACXVUM_01730 [Williamsia sp. SKLECPSW1]
MNNEFVNGFAATAAPAAGLWSVERLRSASAVGYHAPATQAVEHHAAAAEAILGASAPARRSAFAPAARPAIPVHT